MNKDTIIYTLLSISLFFMASLSLLSVQDNDIKIPQKEVVMTLDLKHKFNLNIASNNPK